MRRGKSVLEFDMIVGRNIRQLRKYARISQEELADRIGVTFQQVQKYEHATNRVSAGKLVLISRAVECSLLNLFEGIDPGIRRRATAHSVEAMHAAALFDRVPPAQQAAFIGLLSTMTETASHG